MIEFGTVEDGMVSKVVLEPSCLSLSNHHQQGRCHPCKPVVAKIPENPDSKNVGSNDMSKMSHKEPGIDFEHPLSIKRSFLNNNY